VTSNSSARARLTCSSATRVLHWPLWGVLFTGIISALLWEHGEIFVEHLTLLFACLITLPLIGGVLTPAKPSYTAIVFAAGSYLPLPDSGPIAIGLWPFLWVFGYFDRPRPAELPLEILLTALAGAAMFAALLPLVYLGWVIRRRCGFRLEA
jgi:hypothetical protein